MIFSYTQISQYLSCPRRYKHRYLDGWQEKDTRAAMLFGRAFEQAASAIQFPDRIHEGHEVVLAGQGLCELNLQVAPGLADANPIVLGESLEQLHTRLQHAIPAVALGIVETAVPVSCPLPVEHRGGIFS